MKKLLIVLFASTALGACAAPPAPSGTETAAEPTVTALAAKTDADLADAKAHEVLGAVGAVLHGGDVNAPYELGEAFFLHYVDASAVRGWDRTSAPETLIPPAVDRVYPVLLDGQVVASITLHKRDGVWESSAIGQGSASHRLVDARTLLRATHSADGNAYAVVHVIGTSERFLAYHENATMLASVKTEDTPAPRAAAEVFAGLSIP